MKEALLFRTKLSVISIEEISNLLVNHKNISVAVCNSNSVVRGARSGGMAKMLNNLTFRICDGYPLSKAINYLYGLNQERVDGFNTFHRTIFKGVEKNTKHYFFGNEEKVVIKMINELEEAYPEINIVGYHCPPFQDIKEFNKRFYLNLLDNVEADIVWVSLGFPKQELFMNYIIKNKSNDFNIIGVGNVFDWTAKTKYKAPDFLADHGMEWVVRFAQEPIRLARRYLIDNTLFLLFFVQQYFGKNFYKKKKNIKKNIQ